MDLHQKVFNNTFFGKKLVDLQRYASDFLDQVLEKNLYSPMMARLHIALKQHCCLILSNSPEFMVEMIAKRLGIDHWKGTEYDIDQEGRLINVKALLDGSAKREFLMNFSKVHGFSESDVYAYSDSHLDLPFLESAKYPIAVQPDRKLYRVAQKRGWEIL